MDLELRVAHIETDIAVIRTNLENHTSELRTDVREVREDVHGLREDIAALRDKTERLFGTVLSRRGGLNGVTGNGAWQLAVMGAGWLFGLILLILQNLLK